jgi:Cu/Ag efflux protein CusF
VQPAEYTLRLEHDAIPELKWPSMTMNFRVHDTVSLDHVEVGDDIHFAMVEEGGAWVIDQVHVMGSTTASEEHGND